MKTGALRKLEDERRIKKSQTTNQKIKVVIPLKILRELNKIINNFQPLLVFSYNK